MAKYLAGIKYMPIFVLSNQRKQQDNGTGKKI